MQKSTFSTLLLILLFFQIGEARNPNAVYVHEGFNSPGFPADWSRVRLSGSLAQWGVIGVGSNPSVAPFAGTGQAKYNSFDAASGEQARMTTPAMNLATATDPYLTFAMYHEDEYTSSFDSLYIEISTADSISGPWTPLQGIRRPRPTRGWTREAISLYAYRGSSRVFLSLRGVSKYGNNIFVDEFRVADSSFHDLGTVTLSANSIPIEDSHRVGLDEQITSRLLTQKMNSSPEAPAIFSVFNNTQIDIRAIARNYGTFNEPSYNIGWRVNGQTQASVAGRPVAARTGRDTVTLPWTNPTPGLHTITAWTILSSDSNRVNDTTRLTVQVLEAGTVFYETFNGGSFPPPGWAVINRDGGVLPPWFAGADTSAFVPIEGSGFAANNFQRRNSTYLDDYLITPPIPGVGQAGLHDSLVFWTRSQFNSPPTVNFPDSLMVLVSTTGIDTSNFSVRLDYFTVPKTGWSRKAYVLTGRVPTNSTVHIAFRYLLYNVGATSGSGDFVGVDAVQIIRAIPTDVSSTEVTPTTFALEQNYPNPFNPTTLIQFSLPQREYVALRIFDLLGKEIATLVQESLAPGTHDITFDASRLASGVYYYRVTAGPYHTTKKMIVLK